MKKLIYRKVKIVKTVPTVDITRWFSPREIAEFNKVIKPKKKPLSLRLKEQKEYGGDGKPRIRKVTATLSVDIGEEEYLV